MNSFPGLIDEDSIDELRKNCGNDEFKLVILESLIAASRKFCNKQIDALANTKGRPDE